MKRMARIVTLATAVLVLVLAQACGSSGRPAAGPTPSGSPTPAALPGSIPGGQPAATLGDADSGRSLQLHKGQVVSIALHEASGFTQWSRLATTDGSVLMPIVDTRAAAVRGVTLGSFEAVGPGTAQITSTATADCTPGTQCAALARSWTVTVSVA
jgi:predicted secreted protein